MGECYFGKADAEALVLEAGLDPSLVDKRVMLEEGGREPVF